MNTYLCTISALLFTITTLNGMTPNDYLPSKFIPKEDCSLSRKLRITVENLPGYTKDIASHLLNEAIKNQKPLHADLKKLMRFYGKPITLAASNGSHNYASLRYTEQIACICELTSNIRTALGQLFRYAAPLYYLSPETLVAESTFIEHQILNTQCLVYRLQPATPLYIYKKKSQKKMIKKYNTILRNLLPQELHTCIEQQNMRPLHRLVMLAYDIQHTEKQQKNPENAAVKDLIADMRENKRQFCVVQAYTGSRWDLRIDLVVEQIRNLVKKSGTSIADDKVYAMAKEFISNAKAATAPPAQH